MPNNNPLNLTEEDNIPEVKEWRTERTEEEKIKNRELNKRRKLKMELQKNVGLKVFLIGVGNAGNQTVAIGHKEGMNVFAINSSIKDLSDSIIDDTIPSFIVGNEARGSGKNIQKGISVFKENGKELFSLEGFMKPCQEADVIFIISSTGGGTGPSVSPELCKILKGIFPKKIVMYYGITPKNSDSNIAFSNTMYCVDVIRNLQIPYMFTDLEAFANVPNDEAFRKADKHVIDTIKVITGDLLTESSAQMMDENDLKMILSEPGYCAAYGISGITSNQLESATMQSLLINEIKNSASVMLQKDGIAIHMGVMINCPSDLNDVTRSGNYDELYNFIGHKPKKGVYENYVTDDNGTTGELRVVVSGMTFPINRFSIYSDSILEQKEFIEKSKAINISDDVEMIQSLISDNQPELSSDTKADEKTIESVLGNYF